MGNSRQARPKCTLILERPLIFRDERIDHLFHGKVRNQLVLRQFDTRHRIEMSNTLQMFFDVLAFVCDARWRYNRFVEDFEAYFAAQEIGHIAFLVWKKNLYFIVF